MSLLLAQAAVNDANIHFDKLYSYRIPAELRFEKNEVAMVRLRVVF